MTYPYYIKKIYKNIILPIICMYFRRITKYTHTGKIALCCIAKQENEYIRFFVEYYKNLHFDRIILYDNNELDGERFEDVIGDYIQSGFVELVDYRGKKAPQLKAYQDCYDRFNKKYDWIAFFDCDEFLTFVDGTDNIHEFLNRSAIKPFQMLHINWKVFGDNDMLDTDGRNVIERFKDPIMPYDFKSFDFTENSHIKSIVRGGLYIIRWNETGHTPTCPLYQCCNAKGTPVALNSFFQDIDYSTAYIRHYSTKTIGEWVRLKMKRGDVFYLGEKGKQMTSLDYFFRYNNKTEEKLRYAEKLMGRLS